MNSKHLGLAAGVLALLGTATAHAEPIDGVEVTAPRAKRHHKRMALELAGVFAVGNRWYWRDNGQPNEVDWQLPFDGRALEAKLGTGGGWRFDGNPYDINALGHPGFGMLTHLMARENHYGIGEAFLISTLASGTWEVFLEWAEYGSLNDLLTTSTAGIPLGETAHQILHHADETVFTASAGVGTSGGTPFGIVAVGGDLSTVPTRGEGTVRGGRAVRFGAELEADDAVRSVAGGARTNLAGWYQHRAQQHLFGALTTHFDYKNDRKRAERDWDLMTTVGIGPTLDLSMRKGGVTVSAGADAFVDVALVRSQAYDTWRAAHPTEIIRNVMQDKAKPYYYGVGATFAPHVDLSYRKVRLGGAVRGSLFGSLDGQDRDREMITANPHFTDTETRAEAWLGYTGRRMSVTLEGRAHRRAGSAEDTQASTADRTAMVMVGFNR